MQWWQFFASGLGHHSQLVVRDDLEKRLSQQAKTLDLFRRLATVLGLVVLAHGIDSLLNQRLAGLDHANEGTLVHCPTPIT